MCVCVSPIITLLYEGMDRARKKVYKFQMKGIYFSHERYIHIGEKVYTYRNKANYSVRDVPLVKLGISVRLFALALLLCAPLWLRAQTLASPFAGEPGALYQSALWRYFEEITPLKHTRLDKALYSLPTETAADTSWASVGVLGDYGARSGVRAPYEGATVASGQLRASGIKNFGKSGRLSGYAVLGAGYEGEIGYSAIRHPDFYLPYLVADTSGGNFRYEQYAAGALYALRRGASEFGAGLHFAGEIAYKYEDPRVYNTTGSLQATLGYKRHLSQLECSATLHALYHRKYMHLWLWRPSQQDKFPLTYGFGMVDVQHTKIFFGTSRMHYMGGGAADLLIRSKQNSPDAFSYTALLSYQLYTMRTEESSSIGLFGHTNHRLTLLTHVEKARWYFTAEGVLLRRLGTEYIYALHQPDEEHLTITDQRLIGKRQTYTLAEYNAEVKGGYRMPIASNHHIDFTLGTGYRYREECYKGSDNNTNYAVLRPWLGISYGYKQHILSCFSAAYRMPLSATYKVESGFKDQLDYQLAYLPLVGQLKSGIELRWSNRIGISLPRKKCLLLGVEAFYAPETLMRGFPLYKGTPSTTSGIFSNPENIPSRSHSYGFRCTLTVQI